VGALAADAPPDAAAPRRFLLVAGEASGDLHAAKLVRALAGLGPCEVRGVAGPALREAGMRAIVPMEEIAVLGFAEVLAALPRLVRARARLLAEARAFRPQAVCLVDFPGFNFHMAPRFKAMGIPVFYYIAPQVWAWHRERARHMAAWTDRLAVVFPFEVELFRSAGVTVSFVGHPLMDELAPEVDRAAFESEVGGRGPLLALLPGSRVQEVDRHLPVMLRAARRLRDRHPELRVVTAVAPGLDQGRARRMVEALEPTTRVLAGRTRAVQAYATAAAVASGTASLETALFATPLVVVYRLAGLSFQLARRMITLRRIGLPNIVAEQDVAPELIQDALTPEALAGQLEPWLFDPAARAGAAQRLRIVRERLGGPGASARAARLLWELAAQW
jgi:lipid-A-disaccharide synthase